MTEEGFADDSPSRGALESLRSVSLGIDRSFESLCERAVELDEKFRGEAGMYGRCHERRDCFPLVCGACSDGGLDE